MLGATVDGLAASNIFRASGGMPSAVVEFVAEAERTGALIFERGLWHLQGALTPSVTLRRSVAQRLTGLSPESNHALTLLAVAEAMPVVAMEAGVADDIVADLETRGLIATTGRGTAMTVTVASPVVAVVLQADTSALRRRQLLRDAARLVQGMSNLHPRQAMQVAVWHVEAGLPVDPALLAEGAHHASAQRDYVAQLPLAQAAHQAEPSLDMLLLAAEAMYELGYYRVRIGNKCQHSAPEGAPSTGEAAAPAAGGAEAAPAAP